MTEPTTARHNMVECQLRPNRVVDEALVAAFETVPRERFVPKKLRPMAYVDEDLQIAPGRWLTEPMVLGKLLQQAQLKRDDVVLVVGAATGYAVAVAAHVARAVVGVETDPELARGAEASLAELSVDNALIVQGDCREGCTAHAPYSLILIEGAVAEIPAALPGQLGEGGRIVCVERPNPDAPGVAVLAQQVAGTLSRRRLFDAQVPFLDGCSPRPSFAF